MVINHQQFDLFNKMIFEKAVMKAPFKMPNNMPNEACFLYVLDGQVQTCSAVEKEHLQPKDSLLMKCGLYISEWIESENSERCEAIAVHLYPEVLKKIYADEIPQFVKNFKQKGKHRSIHKMSNHKLIDNYIQNMDFYFKNPQLVDEELIKVKLKELILLLMRTEKAESIVSLISSLFCPQEYQFKEIIEANVFTGLSVEELALLTNLSVSSFKREFTKIFNDSPARYLKKRKLERAAYLLQFSNNRIGEIAFDCGFNDQAHFSKSFQIEYKLSPSSYRMIGMDKKLG